MGVTATETPGRGIPVGAGAPGGPGRSTAVTERPVAGRAGQVRGAVRGATPLALAALFANGANVLVTLVIARELSTRSYGASAQLLAMYFVVSMPGSALLVGVVRRVTTWQRCGGLERIGPWVRKIRRTGMALVVVIGVAGLLARGLLVKELSLPGGSGVVEILTAGAAWSVLCVDRGLLQCGRLYGSLAVNVLVEGTSRSIVTVLLVLAGLKQDGVAIAMLAAVVVCVAHARWVLARHPTTAAAADPDAPSEPVVTGDAPPRRLAIEVGAALTALALLGLLQNVDVLILGRLSPGGSGAYAAVSVACKALVFGAVVLAGFLLPETANRRHLGQHALHQLSGMLAILAAPAAILLAVALAAPETLLRLAFGPRLTGASTALLPLAAAMTCLGATVLFTHYLLAVGSRKVLAVLAVAAAVAIGLLVRADGHAAPTARADLICQAGLAVATGLMVLAAARRTARR